MDSRDGLFYAALDATILNTALPAIAQSLNRSPLAMQSAIISYTLTVAMLIPVSGWLADRFGTRRIFMLAVSLFTLGSLACALSNSLGMLVVFRVIQGIGGAMMMPVARLALLRAIRAVNYCRCSTLSLCRGWSGRFLAR